MRPDACGICLLKQTASGAQSVTSPSKIEEFREFEADLSALLSPKIYAEASNQKERGKIHNPADTQKKLDCICWLWRV